MTDDKAPQLIVLICREMKTMFYFHFYNEEENIMIYSVQYPYPTYVPNPTVAICVSVIEGISLIAWLIQSIQVRFQPRRMSILLLISHLMICAELIVRAILTTDEQNSQIMFGVITGLFATGQRMIIVSNFSFVLEIHHERTRLARGIFLGATLCVITSGCFIIPANMLAFQANTIDKSLIYRIISAVILLVTALVFFVVLHWSDTIKDMTRQGLTLITISSSLCLIVTIFNLIQSSSRAFYDEFNKQEGWFYGFNIAPIVITHFTWSILHPKRSLTIFCPPKTTNRYANFNNNIHD